MSPRDPTRENETRIEPRPDERESPERTVAPPIEREHETYQGILEEDEKREHERE
jgi:hypothetical protein